MSPAATIVPALVRATALAPCVAARTIANAIVVRRAGSMSGLERRGDRSPQPHGRVADFVGADDQRRNEPQRVAAGGVDEEAVVEAVRDEVLDWKSTRLNSQHPK